MKSIDVIQRLYAGFASGDLPAVRPVCRHGPRPARIAGVMDARGDHEVLSSDRMIWPLVGVLLLLLVLAPLAKQPLPVDRLGDLAVFLGDPIEKEARLRGDDPRQSGTPWDARSD